MVLIAHHQQRVFNPTSQTVEWHSRDKALRRLIVKEHHATRLHFDFRLEYAGFLKSWLVPDGPCLDANEKRSAIQVSDHVIDDSERTIPAGMYGAGPVMLWDQGFWITDEDVGEALCAGQLNFRLYGKKLKGGWTLTRCRPRSGQRQREWKLRKVLDAEARSLQEMNILIEQPRSVRTGRTLDEVARGVRPLIPGRLPRKQTRDPRQRILFLDGHLS